MLDDRLFSRTDDRDLSSDVCLADHLAHDLGQWIIACLHQIHDLDLGRSMRLAMPMLEMNGI